MLLFGLFEEASSRGLSPEIVLQLIPFILPKALMFAMPATCLLSVCVVFGRMSADNELIAVRSLGLHPSVVIIPTLVVTFFLSLFAVWVNDLSFAWGYWGIEKVVLESSDKIVYGVLKNEGSFRTDNFSIEVQGIQDRTLIHPTITYKSGNDHVRLVAHQALIETDPDSHSLVFTLERGSANSDNREFRIRFDNQIRHEVQLMTSDQIAKATGNPSHLYLGQIKEEVSKQEVDLQDIQTNDSVRACSQLLSGNLIGLTHPEWRARATKKEEAEHRLNRLKVVPHRRWANGFSCFAFAMIGIPMAIRLRTSNYATTFAVCFIPILILYYPLFMFGLNGAKTGSLPPYAAWLGNVACLLVGSYLMFKEFKR